MSDENEVVAIESNPTNEDLSIDNAINSLYEAEEPTEVVAEETPHEEPQDVVDDADKVVEEEPEEDAPSEDEPFSLPENMPKELQDSLSGLDEEVQKKGVEVFKKMQGSFTKKNQDFAEEKKFAEGINRAFETNGRNADAAQKQALVSNYIAFDKQLETNPKEAVKRMMDYAGLKPEDFGTNPTPTDSSEDEFLTETELQLKSQLNAQADKINKLEQRETQDRDRAQSKIVDEFFDAKDEQGNLQHPHFDVVYNDMKMLAGSNPNLTIEQLYNKSVRMNDDLYNQTMERERKAVLSSADAKRQEAVDKAKKLNRQSRPTSSADSVIVDDNAIMERLVTEAGWV